MIEYTYDYQNRLVERDVTGGTADHAYYVHQGDNIALELDGLQSGDLTHRYLWGAAVDQLLADDQIGGELLWPLGDHEQTIRDVIDSSGQTRIHREYDSFGKIITETKYDTAGTVVPDSHAEAVDELFAYTGRQLDKDTGQQNNLNRWYDPLVGRWLNEDPIGFDAGDMNLYRYVGNNPVGNVDPSGLDWSGFSGVDWFGSSIDASFMPGYQYGNGSNFRQTVNSTSTPSRSTNGPGRLVAAKPRRVDVLTSTAKEMADHGMSDSAIQYFQTPRTKTALTFGDVVRELGLDPSTMGAHREHFTVYGEKREIWQYYDKSGKIWRGIPMHANVEKDGQPEQIQVGMQFWNDDDLLKRQVNQQVWMEGAAQMTLNAALFGLGAEWGAGGGAKFLPPPSARFRLPPAGSNNATVVARQLLREGDVYLGVVKDGKIIAQTSNTLLPHAQFVRRTLGELPKGSEVVTFGKTKEGISVLRSRTFHGNSLPASKEAINAVKAVYK